jgi:hypothetical protein
MSQPGPWQTVVLPITARPPGRTYILGSHYSRGNHGTASPSSVAAYGLRHRVQQRENGSVGA